MNYLIKKANSYLVFVYGTLMSDHRLNYYLEHGRSQKIGKGKIHGELWDMGYFPVAIQSENDIDTIYGEVWKVNERTWNILCSIENMYTPTIQHVIMNDNTELDNVYAFIATPDSPISYHKKWKIEHGDYDRYIKEEERGENINNNQKDNN